MTTLYIIRHAQSEGNGEGRMQGSSDRGLSAVGLRQLEYLAERCRHINATHIYTSPLLRARATAEAANKFLRLPVTEMPDLREISVGMWENQTFDYIEQAWPEERRIWREEHHRFVSPGGETMAQVYIRVATALGQIAELHPGQAVLVVSHGCSIRNMCAWAMGGPEKAGAIDWVENVSVTRIDIDSNGSPKLVCIGDISHLPKEDD